MFGTTTSIYAFYSSVFDVSSDAFSGTISIIGHLITNLWPIMIGVFILFGVIGFIWAKAKGIGR